MNTKCLIIAAGKGRRLQMRGDSKPLVSIFGMPLIERVIRAAHDAGGSDFYVVTGYLEGKVREFLDLLNEQLEIPITTIFNEDWEKENGLSVLKGRQHLNESFLLLMADHIFDPSIARKLIASPLNDGEIALGVDTNLKNPLVNLDDVTKVARKNGKICDIGKTLENFDGFDTGIFHCTPAIFSAIERSSERGDTSLSGGVRILAEENRVNAVDVGGHYWVDVDDPEALRWAENVLLNHLPG
ncbi:MAG: NTP transferase domain-containing protein [Nitrospinales bacterium]